MPPLKVEYAKSGRSRCSLKECNKFIEKGELRVGTAVMMPGMDDPSFKWRHICCFTARQVKNSGGSVDNIEGFETLTEADQRLVTKMMSGALVGDHSLLGKTGTAAAAGPPAHGEGRTGGAAEAKRGDVPSTTPPPKKRAPTKRTRATGTSGGNGDDAASDATDDYDLLDTVAPAGPTKKPPCPYGAKCFRKNPDHFLEFHHGESAPEMQSPLASAGGRSAVVVTTAIKKPSPPIEPPVTAALATTSASQPPSVVKPLAAAEGGEPGRCPYGDLCFRTDAAHVARFHAK